MINNLIKKIIGISSIQDDTNVELSDFELYEAIRRIANMFFEDLEETLAKATFLNVEVTLLKAKDRRQDTVNPHFNHTRQGLFLEFRSNNVVLWTPWGEWSFCEKRKGPWKLIDEGILKRLGAKRHKTLGAFSVVYALYRIGDLKLPKPIENVEDTVLPYNKTLDYWQQLTEEYSRE